MAKCGVEKCSNERTMLRDHLTGWCHVHLSMALGYTDPTPEFEARVEVLRAIYGRLAD